MIEIRVRVENGHVIIIKNNYELADFNLHEEYDLGAIMDFLKKIIEKSLKEEE